MPAKPTNTTPCWATSATFPQFAKLAEDLVTDVVVIGAGITGLSVAAQIEIEKLCGKVHVESADVAGYVKGIADEAYADIVVIGRSPDRDVPGRLRTHAYALIRESPCPVISHLGTVAEIH